MGGSDADDAEAVGVHVDVHVLSLLPVGSAREELRVVPLHERPELARRRRMPRSLVRLAIRVAPVGAARRDLQLHPPGHTLALVGVLPHLVAHVAEPIRRRTPLGGVVEEDALGAVPGWREGEKGMEYSVCRCVCVSVSVCYGASDTCTYSEKD